MAGMGTETAFLIRGLEEAWADAKRTGFNELRGLTLLICPECGSCEFPGCANHNSFVCTPKTSRAAYCTLCDVEASSCASTDTSEPWCVACSSCRLKRAKPYIGFLHYADVISFFKAAAVTPAVARPEYRVFSASQIKGTALVCKGCASISFPSDPATGKLLDSTDEACSAALDVAEATARHCIPCTSSFYRLPVYIEQTESRYLASTFPGSNVVTANLIATIATREALSPAETHDKPAWVTHPDVDAAPARTPFCVRQTLTLPDSRYALAQIDGAPHAYPVWESRGFVGQFGDPFLKNTELEGGRIRESIAYLRHYLARVAAVHGAALPADVPAAITAVRELLAGSMPIANEMDALAVLFPFEGGDFSGATPVDTAAVDAQAILDRGPEQDVASIASTAFLASVLNVNTDEAMLVRTVVMQDRLLAQVVQRHLRAVAALPPGGIHVFPGGYRDTHGGHGMMFALVRGRDGGSTPTGTGTADDGFDLLVTNTGDGKDFHPSQVSEGKLKHVTTICLSNIPRVRVLLSAFWIAFYRVAATANETHSASRLYGALLPALVGASVMESWTLEPAHLNRVYRTTQRSGTCYYRCVTDMARHLLALHGVPSGTWKQISYLLRLEVLKDTLHDMNVAATLADGAAVPLIRIAARQTARAAVKKHRPARELEELRLLVLGIERRLASLPVPTTALGGASYLASGAAALEFEALKQAARTRLPGLAKLEEKDDGRRAADTADAHLDATSPALAPAPPAPAFTAANGKAGSITFDLPEAGEDADGDNGSANAALVTPLLKSSKSLFQRQGSVDAATADTLSDVSTHAGEDAHNGAASATGMIAALEARGVSDSDMVDLLLPPRSLAELPDPSQRMVYLPPVLGAQATVSAGCALFGGFDAFSVDGDAVRAQNEGPEINETVVEMPNLIKPSVADIGAAGDALTRARDDAIQTLTSLSTELSGLIAIPSLSARVLALQHAVAVLSSAAVPPPRTLRERGLDVLRFRTECTSSDRRRVCVWQDTEWAISDVRKTTKVLLSIAEKIYLCANSCGSAYGQDAPSAEARNLIASAAVFAIVDALIRVTATSGAGDAPPTWAAIFEGTDAASGPPVPVAMSMTLENGTMMDSITSQQAAVSPEYAVLRARVMAYLKEREARAATLLMKADDLNPTLETMNRFVKCARYELKLTKPTGERMTRLEGCVGILCSTPPGAVGAMQNSIAETHREFTDWRDTGIFTRLLLMSTKSRQNMCQPHMWSEYDAPLRWSAGDMGQFAQDEFFIAILSLNQSMPLSFSPRSTVPSPASAAYYLPAPVGTDAPPAPLRASLTAAVRESGAWATYADGSSVVLASTSQIGPANHTHPAYWGCHDARQHVGAGATLKNARALDEVQPTRDELPAFEPAPTFRTKTARDDPEPTPRPLVVIAQERNALAVLTHLPEAFDLAPGASDGTDGAPLNDQFILRADFDTTLVAEVPERVIAAATELPNFAHMLTTEASRRLISALSEPYLRIPLIAAQFAEGARIGWLQSPSLRELLFAVLFEPGRFMSPRAFDKALTHIPAHPFRLGTPHGLLLNELVHAPAATIAPLCTAFDAVASAFPGVPALIKKLNGDVSPTQTDTFSAALEVYWGAEGLAAASSLPTASTAAGFFFAVRVLAKVARFSAFAAQQCTAAASATYSPADTMAVFAGRTAAEVASLTAQLRQLQLRLIRIALPLLLCWRRVVLQGESYGDKASSRSDDAGGVTSSPAARMGFKDRYIATAIHSHIALALSCLPVSSSATAGSARAAGLFDVHAEGLTAPQAGVLLGALAFTTVWGAEASGTKMVDAPSAYKLMDGQKPEPEQETEANANAIPEADEAVVDSSESSPAEATLLASGAVTTDEDVAAVLAPGSSAILADGSDERELSWPAHVPTCVAEALDVLTQCRVSIAAFLSATLAGTGGDALNTLIAVSRGDDAVFGLAAGSAHQWTLGGADSRDQGAFVLAGAGLAFSLTTGLVSNGRHNVQPAPPMVANFSRVIDVAFGRSSTLMLMHQKTTANAHKWTVFGQDASIEVWDIPDRDNAVVALRPTQLPNHGGFVYMGLEFSRRFGAVRLGQHEAWVARLMQDYRDGFYHEASSLSTDNWFLPARELGSEASVVTLLSFARTEAQYYALVLSRARRSATLHTLWNLGHVYSPRIVLSSHRRLAHGWIGERDHDDDIEALMQVRGFSSGLEIVADSQGFADHSIKPEQAIVIRMPAPAVPAQLRFSLLFAPRGDQIAVPSAAISGLVPSVLAEKFSFWLSTADRCIRGTPLREHLADPELRYSVIIKPLRLPSDVEALYGVESPVEFISAEVVAERSIEAITALGRTGALVYRAPLPADLTADIASSEDATALARHDIGVRLLINMSASMPGSTLGRLADVVTRAENLSHVLAWAVPPPELDITPLVCGLPAPSSSPVLVQLFRSDDGPAGDDAAEAAAVSAASVLLRASLQLDTVWMPRLNLALTAKTDASGRTRLFLREHPEFYISDVRSPVLASLLMGAPHSLLLQTTQNSFAVLMPNYNVMRPNVQSRPLSTDLMQLRHSKLWLRHSQSRYYIYPVHSSQQKLIVPAGLGIAPACYLLQLRLLHRMYDDAFQLAGSLGVDSRLSAEEKWMLTGIQTSLGDMHPDAVAVRLKILHTMRHCPDSPTLMWTLKYSYGNIELNSMPYNVSTDISEYSDKLHIVSARLRMSQNDMSALQDDVHRLRDVALVSQPRTSLTENLYIGVRNDVQDATLRHHLDGWIYTAASMPGAVPGRFAVRRSRRNLGSSPLLRQLNLALDELDTQATRGEPWIYQNGHVLPPVPPGQPKLGGSRPGVSNRLAMEQFLGLSTGKRDAISRHDPRVQASAAETLLASTLYAPNDPTPPHLAQTERNFSNIDHADDAYPTTFFKHYSELDLDSDLPIRMRYDTQRMLFGLYDSWEYANFSVYDNARRNISKLAKMATLTDGRAGDEEELPWKQMVFYARPEASLMSGAGFVRFFQLLLEDDFSGRMNILGAVSAIELLQGVLHPSLDGQGEIRPAGSECSPEAVMVAMLFVGLRNEVKNEDTNELHVPLAVICAAYDQAWARFPEYERRACRNAITNETASEEAGKAEDEPEENDFASRFLSLTRAGKNKVTRASTVKALQECPPVLLKPNPEKDGVSALIDGCPLASPAVADSAFVKRLRRMFKSAVRVASDTATWWLPKRIANTGQTTRYVLVKRRYIERSLDRFLSHRHISCSAIPRCLLDSPKELPLLLSQPLFAAELASHLALPVTASAAPVLDSADTIDAATAALGALSGHPAFVASPAARTMLQRVVADLGVVAAARSGSGANQYDAVLPEVAELLISSTVTAGASLSPADVDKALSRLAALAESLRVLLQRDVILAERARKYSLWSANVVPLRKLSGDSEDAADVSGDSAAGSHHDADGGDASHTAASSSLLATPIISRTPTAASTLLLPTSSFDRQGSVNAALLPAHTLVRALSIKGQSSTDVGMASVTESSHDGVDSQHCGGLGERAASLGAVPSPESLLARVLVFITKASSAATSARASVDEALELFSDEMGLVGPDFIDGNMREYRINGARALLAVIQPYVDGVYRGVPAAGEVTAPLAEYVHSLVDALGTKQWAEQSAAAAVQVETAPVFLSTADAADTTSPLRVWEPRDLLASSLLLPPPPLPPFRVTSAVGIRAVANLTLTEGTDVLADGGKMPVPRTHVNHDALQLLITADANAADRVFDGGLSDDAKTHTYAELRSMLGVAALDEARREARSELMAAIASKDPAAAAAATRRLTRLLRARHALRLQVRTLLASLILRYKLLVRPAVRARDARAWDAIERFGPAVAAFQLRAIADASESLRRGFVLARYAGEHASVDLDRLHAASMSLVATTPGADALAVWNPYLVLPYAGTSLTPEQTHAAFAMYMLRVSRISLLQRALFRTRSLAKSIAAHYARSLTPSPLVSPPLGGLVSPPVAGLKHSDFLALSQQHSALVAALLTGRYIATAAPDTDGQSEAVYTFDPRFLAFEYAAEIVLRPEQVTLVRKFLDSPKVPFPSMAVEASSSAAPAGQQPLPLGVRSAGLSFRPLVPPRLPVVASATAAYATGFARALAARAAAQHGVQNPADVTVGSSDVRHDDIPRFAPDPLPKSNASVWDSLPIFSLQLPVLEELVAHQAALMRGARAVPVAQTLQPTVSVSAEFAPPHGSSRVHQMLMGAGKTTVVGPLVLMIISGAAPTTDTGGHMAVCAAPPALVPMTLSVLRDRLSSFFHIPVRMFEFQRDFGGFCGLGSQFEPAPLAAAKKLEALLDKHGVLVDDTFVRRLEDIMSTADARSSLDQFAAQTSRPDLAVPLRKTQNAAKYDVVDTFFGANNAYLYTNSVTHDMDGEARDTDDEPSAAHVYLASCDKLADLLRYPAFSAREFSTADEAQSANEKATPFDYLKPGKFFSIMHYSRRLEQMQASVADLRATGGVLVASDVSLKSLMLKAVEVAGLMADTLRDMIVRLDPDLSDEVREDGPNHLLLSLDGHGERRAARDASGRPPLNAQIISLWYQAKKWVAAPRKVKHPNSGPKFSTPMLDIRDCATEATLRVSAELGWLLARRFPASFLQLHSLESAHTLLCKAISDISASVLILDEVDVLTHPLRSELNFPIGPRLPLEPTPVRWDIPIALYDALFTALEAVAVPGDILTGVSALATRSVAVPRGGWRLTSAAASALAHTAAGQSALTDLAEALSETVASGALVLSPHPTLISEAEYHTHLAPAVARWLTLFLLARGVRVGAASVAASEDSQELLYAYLTAASVAVTPSEVDDKPAEDDNSVGARVQRSFSPLHIGLLNLARDWVRSLLPHTLSKANRVTYGLLPASYLAQHGKQTKTRTLGAVPYAGKDTPTAASEFAHPDILAGLTVLAYRVQGLRRDDLRFALVSLKRAFAQEPGPVQRRPTSVKFAAWVAAARTAANTSTADALDLQRLQPADPAHMQAAQCVLGSSPALVEYYLQEHVFPVMMQRQSTNLGATGYDLGSRALASRRMGFSGTPSNALPSGLGGRCHFEVGSEARIVSTLVSDAVCTMRALTADWSPLQLLASVARAESPPLHALIDTGALVTGYSNEEAANLLLSLGLPHADGVIFLGEDNEPLVVLRHRGELAADGETAEDAGASAERRFVPRRRRPVVPLAQCGIPPERRFSFYDQVHTVGIDIAHAPNAVAAITLGKDLTLRDYSQGAYRMRGIGKGQCIVTLVPPEVLRLVAATARAIGASVSSDRSPTPSGVLQWLMVNSARAEQRQVAQHHALRAVETLRAATLRRSFAHREMSRAYELGHQWLDGVTEDEPRADPRFRSCYPPESLDRGAAWSTKFVSSALPCSEMQSEPTYLRVGKAPFLSMTARLNSSYSTDYPLIVYLIFGMFRHEVDCNGLLRSIIASNNAHILTFPPNRLTCADELVAVLQSPIAHDLRETVPVAARSGANVVKALATLAEGHVDKLRMSRNYIGRGLNVANRHSGLASRLLNTLISIPWPALGLYFRMQFTFAANFRAKALTSAIENDFRAAGAALLAEDTAALAANGVASGEASAAALALEQEMVTEQEVEVEVETEQADEPASSVYQLGSEDDRATGELWSVAHLALTPAQSAAVVHDARASHAVDAIRSGHGKHVKLLRAVRTKLSEAPSAASAAPKAYATANDAIRDILNSLPAATQERMKKDFDYVVARLRMGLAVDERRIEFPQFVGIMVAVSFGNDVPVEAVIDAHPSRVNAAHVAGADSLLTIEDLKDSQLALADAQQTRWTDALLVARGHPFQPAGFALGAFFATPAEAEAALPPTMLVSRLFDPSATASAAGQLQPAVLRPPVQILLEWHVLTRGAPPTSAGSVAAPRVEGVRDLVRALVVAAGADAGVPDVKHIFADRARVCTLLRTAGLVSEAAELSAVAAGSDSNVTATEVERVLLARSAAVWAANAPGTVPNEAAVTVTSHIAPVTLSEAASLRKALHSGGLEAALRALAAAAAGADRSASGSLASALARAAGVAVRLRVVDLNSDNATAGTVVDSWAALLAAPPSARGPAAADAARKAAFRRLAPDAIAPTFASSTQAAAATQALRVALTVLAQAGEMRRVVALGQRGSSAAEKWIREPQSGASQLRLASISPAQQQAAISAFSRLPTVARERLLASVLVTAMTSAACAQTGADSGSLAASILASHTGAVLATPSNARALLTTALVERARSAAARVVFGSASGPRAVRAGDNAKQALDTIAALFRGSSAADANARVRVSTVTPVHAARFLLATKALPHADIVRMDAAALAVGSSVDAAAAAQAAVAPGWFSSALSAVTRSVRQVIYPQSDEEREILATSEAARVLVQDPDGVVAVTVRALLQAWDVSRTGTVTYNDVLAWLEADEEKDIV